MKSVKLKVESGELGVALWEMGEWRGEKVVIPAQAGHQAGRRLDRLTYLFISFLSIWDGRWEREKEILNKYSRPIKKKSR
ncbi:hypothetical protein AGMMS49938_13440 [Fibrobacterales bacterium]|nr:hypothetical protein AGMMS49938_13440 [Fibrobacterales bacterium]